MVRLGYNSNGFRSHRLDDALAWLAELGYRAVAITPDVGCLDPAETDPDELDRVGARCRELDLHVVVETGARYVLDPRRKHRPNLLEADSSHRVRLDFLERMLDWCDRLGSPVLSFWSGTLPGDQDQAAALGRLQAAFEHLGPIASARGVALGLEPEPGHLINTLDSWSDLRDRVGPAVALTLDVGHILANQEGDPASLLSQFAAALVNLQLDDMRRGEHHHLAPGEGEVDWPSLSAVIAELPAELPACFELSRDSHRFHQLGPASIQFARSLGIPCFA